MNIPGYRIETLVAEGGMASVYLATQESLERRVALKLLRKFDTPEQSERFVNEGRIIASLNHRNIITIHDIGNVDGQHYISMEYLRGGDLEQRIAQGMTPETALGLTRTLAQCLDFIHGQGIIHRDIKPANVLFRDDEVPILTDFGIAKQLDRDTSLTMDGSALGSPDYLSPEQAECKPLDGRADIYSLGIVLFEMLTGVKPYAGGSYIETVMAHITDPIPDLPPELRRYQPLIDRMIAKRPNDRFASATELVAYLDSLDQGRSDQGLSGKLSGLVGSRQKPAPAKAGPAPTVALPTDALHAGSDGTGRDAGPGTPPPAGARPRLRVVLVAAGVLVLAVGALLISDPPSEEQAVETAAQAPSDDARPAPTGVARHLAEAAAAMQSGRLTSPPEDNAYFHYRKALELQPANPAATQGLAEIAGRYADDAELQIDKGNLDAARLQIENGLGILPGEPRLLALRQRITDLENAEIESLLLQARVAIDANRLTSPAGDNAHDHYRKVLALRPGHEEALDGIEAIADRYADLAEWSIREYEYSEAKVYVRKGLEIRPDHERLLALRQRTNAAKDVPDRIFKGIKSVFD